MASVKVAVRVRPFNDREKAINSKLIINMKNNTTKILHCRQINDISDPVWKEFTFDHSYWSVNPEDEHYACQEQVFTDLGTDVVNAAFEGYNACIFAYGQTGSGKTFTMMGDSINKGLIPRICESLFSRMIASSSYKIEVSYLEIYNEKVKDLLNILSGNNLKVREHPYLGPIVQGLSQHPVIDYALIEKLIVKGNQNRATASTNMNDLSSRSHAIFTITFAQAGFSNNLPTETVSKIHLVDLAGSEKASKYGTCERLKEGCYINKSLVALGNVISSLMLLSKSLDCSKKRVFVRYRDSVLTWLLKDSLGGNSKTIMIAAISPAQCNYNETMSTLRYANRAKSIINKPTVNEDINVKVIRELRLEIEKLKSLIQNEVDSQQNVLATLHQKEEQEKVLTQCWVQKWKETQVIFQEQESLELRKAGIGVVLDSDRPHLICIDDDLLSTGVALYHLMDGETLIGTDEAICEQHIVLTGVAVEPEHCSIVLNNGEAVLYPKTNSLCLVNGILVDKPTKLFQGCLIHLGRTNLFRYNDPVQAAKMRKDGDLSQLNLTRMSLMTWSTPDLLQSPDFTSSIEINGPHHFKSEDERRALVAAISKKRSEINPFHEAQALQLAVEWEQLEKHKVESLTALSNKEAELINQWELLQSEIKCEKAQNSIDFLSIKEELEHRTCEEINKIVESKERMKLELLEPAGQTSQDTNPGEITTDKFKIDITMPEYHNSSDLQITSLKCGTLPGSDDNLIMRDLVKKINNLQMNILHGVETGATKADTDEKIYVLQELRKKLNDLEEWMNHVCERENENIPENQSYPMSSSSVGERLGLALSPALPLSSSSNNISQEPCQCDLLSPSSSLINLGEKSTSLEIRIPSFVLRGSGSSTHYVYEVLIQAGYDQWSVFRRYSRFRDLHMVMKDKYGSPVEVLQFPPKKYIFRNSEGVATERRPQLENYLNYLILACSKIINSPLFRIYDNPHKDPFYRFSHFFKRGIFDIGKHSTS